MASFASGLGRLFHPVSSSLAPHTSRGQRQLESVTEDAHTYDLLYPEAESLQYPQHHAFPFKYGDPSSVVAAANSSDDRGGLNIQYPRDTRVIIGQYIGGNPQIIFDTQPPLLPSTHRRSLDRALSEQIKEELQGNTTLPKSRTAPHTRQSSLTQVTQSIFGSSGLPLSPVNENGGLFARENRRPNTSEGENAFAQWAKEERQETDAMLSTMFGATGHRIAAGTKIHIKPYTSPLSEVSRPLSPGSTRPNVQRRRTPLTRSTTADDFHKMASASVSGTGSPQTERRQSSSILVTRIFYVDSADEESRPAMGDADTEPPYDQAEQRRRPRQGSTPGAPQPNSDLKRFRTPAFAIAMVMFLPLPHQNQRLPPSARTSPAIGHPSALTQPEVLKQLSAEDFDHSVEYVMAHWDSITRALTSLEVIVRCQISGELSQLDVDIPTTPLATPLHGPNAKTSRPRGPPRPALQLPAGALQQSVTIQKAVEMTNRRIVTALQIRGVAVGQGRWGVWREEARGVGKWAGGREQSFFLFNLLTAFLGNHTEWLDLMSSRLRKPKHSRSRDHHPQQQQQHQLVRHRTIIISLDKMAARRIIFLLSTFLQPSQKSLKRSEVPRSDVSTSLPASSTSPLINSPMSRQLSLRRTLSRDRRGQLLKSRHEYEVSRADLDDATETSDDRTITGSRYINPPDGTPQHSRRPSDALSVRSAALPIAAAAPRFRKSSTTTTATILPEAAVPVAHFSSFLPDMSSHPALEQRPGSSGSIASLALHRTLSRSDSVDHSGTSADSQSTGRWFWNSRRGSSTETSETPISSAEGLGIFVSKDLRSRRPGHDLARMVEDAATVVGGQNTPRAQVDHIRDDTETKSVKDASWETDTHEPFPLDLSVDESDGVIDVKLPPLDSQASSFGSMISSPCGMKTNPGSFAERNQPQSPNISTAATLPQQRRSHTVSEVGGWLRRFHQDLSLQALQPYDQLKEEIKYAMRTEPPLTIVNAHEEHDSPGGWTDVCTTLIADITTFTVTRLALRRRNASSSHHQADALLGHSSKENPDEEFIEESLMDHDATLTDAVEKILSHSGQSSHIASRGPSRTVSRPGTPPRPTPNVVETAPPLEVPRSQCKKMVLGALEQVAKSVRDEMAKNDGTKGTDESEGKDTLKEGVRRWFEEVEAAEG